MIRTPPDVEIKKETDVFWWRWTWIYWVILRSLKIAILNITSPWSLLHRGHHSLATKHLDRWEKHGRAKCWIGRRGARCNHAVLWDCVRLADRLGLESWNNFSGHWKNGRVRIGGKDTILRWNHFGENELSKISEQFLTNSVISPLFSLSHWYLAENTRPWLPDFPPWNPMRSLLGGTCQRYGTSARSSHADRCRWVLGASQRLNVGQHKGFLKAQCLFEKKSGSAPGFVFKPKELGNHQP